MGKYPGSSSPEIQFAREMCWRQALFNIFSDAVIWRTMQQHPGHRLVVMYHPVAELVGSRKYHISEIECVSLRMWDCDTLIWQALQQFHKLIHIPCRKLVHAAVKVEEWHVSSLVFQARKHASNSRDTGLSEHVIQEANKAAESVQKEQQVSEGPPVKKKKKCTFSPEDRAVIGKDAAENGNAKLPISIALKTAPLDCSRRSTSLP